MCEFNKIINLQIYKHIPILHLKLIIVLLIIKIITINNTAHSLHIFALTSLIKIKKRTLYYLLNYFEMISPFLTLLVFELMCQSPILSIIGKFYVYLIYYNHFNKKYIYKSKILFCPRKSTSFQFSVYIKFTKSYTIN